MSYNYRHDKGPMDIHELLVLLECKVIDKRQQPMFKPYEYTHYGSAFESVRAVDATRSIVTVEVPEDRLEAVSRIIWDLEVTTQQLADAEKQIRNQTSEKREELRLQNLHPGLKDAYEKYQTLLKLVA